MNSKRIMVTGSAGFIGFHLTKNLLENGFTVLGVDELNDYYDISLKRARLTILNKYRKFSFCGLDISDRDMLSKTFTDFKPVKVVNLAAQAGVRYSLINPYAYMDANLVGFLNILELCRYNDVEGLIYASSSSVYGSNTKIPFSVEDRVERPISLYAATKRASELIAYSYSHLYGIHTTGLRFFTVYGPWGRPDMAIYIFADKISRGERVPLFNYGKMKRDFTFIKDIVAGIRASMEKNYKCEVFNLGNHRSEDIMEVVRLIEVNMGKKAEIELLPIQPGDVLNTFADIDHSKKLLGYEPTTDIDVGIGIFIKWFKQYTGKCE